MKGVIGIVKLANGVAVVADVRNRPRPVATP